MRSASNCQKSELLTRRRSITLDAAEAAADAITPWCERSCRPDLRLGNTAALVRGRSLVGRRKIQLRTRRGHIQKANNRLAMIHSRQLRTRTGRRSRRYQWQTSSILYCLAPRFSLAQRIGSLLMSGWFRPRDLDPGLAPGVERPPGEIARIPTSTSRREPLGSAASLYRALL